MSGICGAALGGVGALDPGSLGRMLDRLAVGKLAAPHGAAEVRDDRILLGARGAPHFRTGAASRGPWGRRLALVFHGNPLVPEPRGDRPEAEVLLDGFSERGARFFEDLRGDFCVAVWDEAEEALHVAADRFRIHTVYYVSAPDSVWFASRLPALVAAPLPIAISVDPGSIVDFVSSSFIPTPRTIYREIRKLPPGAVLTYRRGSVSVVPYWNLDFLHEDPAPPAILQDRLRSAFSDAMRVRLDSDDNPTMGTFLSGGVDSTTVTGVASQLRGRPVKSFSIGFEEQGFDEMDYARVAASAFRCEHHEFRVRPEHVLEILPVLLESFDEPFANASAIPTFYCARLAREHGVEILYAGDGGDELFAGNQRYASRRAFDHYARIPAWVRRGWIEPVLLSRRAGEGNGWLGRARRYVTRARIPYPERLTSYELWNVVPLGEACRAPFLRSLDDGFEPYAMVRSHYRDAPARTQLDRELYVDLKLAISDNDLVKVTRMSEAAGVAARFPFLDARVVECAQAIPARLKMEGTRLRTFFKRAYADLLPKETVAKRKHGFGLPIPIWLRTYGPLRELMLDLILSRTALQRGYFRESAVRDLVARHESDTTSFYGTILWNLVILELWHRQAR